MVFVTWHRLHLLIPGCIKSAYALGEMSLLCLLPGTGRHVHALALQGCCSELLGKESLQQCWVAVLLQMLDLLNPTLLKAY